MNGIKLFGDFEEKITSYRNLLQGIIKEEYDSGKYFDLSSVQVQDTILNRFHDKIKESLESFKESFNKEVVHRSEVLQRYVAKSVEEIISWEGNSNLVQANFVNAVVRYKNKDKIVSKLTQVDHYYGEEDLHNSIKRDPDDFIPSLNGAKVSLDELINNIEIISVSNITGLHSKNIFLSNLLGSLKFKLYSRVKSSERELIKLVDYFYDLRAEDDFPYDSAGLMFVSRDEIGRKIYKFKDFVQRCVGELAEKYNVEPKELMRLANVKTIEENAISAAKKLNPKYSYSNYMEVVNQNNTILTILDEMSRSGQHIDGDTVINGAKVKDWIMHGHQIKHIYEDIRVETWCMTKGMHLNYVGKYLGHTEQYIQSRDKAHLECIRNPNLAKHRRVTDRQGNLIISPNQEYAIINSQNFFREALTPAYRKYAI
ncbi:MAG TPA: hypothetical protein VEC16_05375 [Alphaproteobacteria bacterium]|nr:hypothetical protein [Alphaproteobacteria bacterium]